MSSNAPSQISEKLSDAPPSPPLLSSSLDAKYYTEDPNRWAKFRKHYVREAASEFLGTMILAIFGCASACQVVLSSSQEVASSPKGEYLSIAFGGAVGIALGVWVSGPSGGHVNPVVTLSLAVFRDFPWKKVPVYVLSQIGGGCLGALLVYSNYLHAIWIVDPDKTQLSASLFTSYALDYLPAAACFFSEFFGTAILIIVLFAVWDKHNGPPPPGLVPLVLFILLLGEGVALGMETGASLNPARNLGPRIALAMVGYNRHVLWNYRSQYWLWTGILGPLAGGLVGAFVYDALLYVGADSILNGPSEQKHLASERPASKTRTGTEAV